MGGAEEQTGLCYMEIGRKWTTFDKQIKEVALDLEAEVHGSLMNELFLDLKNVLT